MKQEKNPFFLYIVLVAGILVSARTIVTIVELLQREKIIGIKSEQLATLERENEALHKKLEEVNSVSYTEKIARDKLGLVKDGETIVIMDTDDRGEISSKIEENLPNWRKWWKLFF